MRIGIDARLALRKRRGMGRVLLNTLSGLAALDATTQYYLYLEQRDHERLLPSRENFETRVMQLRCYPLWEQFCLPAACLTDDIALLHCPANTAPLVLPRRVKLVVTLHDVIFLRPLPQGAASRTLYQSAGRLYRRLCTIALSRRVAHIVTASEFSRADIQATLRVPDDKISVIPHGVDPLFFTAERTGARETLTKYGVKSRYVLHLGGTAPNKNTLGAIRAFQQLALDHSYADISLVIVGVPHSHHNEFLSLARQLGLRDRITLTGYIPDIELRDLYSHAELFLFPSLYEGFGLPPLEAMACGTPVVASNLTSVPEAVGDAGVLIDPQNITDVAAAMANILDDDALKCRLIAAGRRRAAMFRWENAAQRLLDLYKTMATYD